MKNETKKPYTNNYFTDILERSYFKINDEKCSNNGADLNNATIWNDYDNYKMKDIEYSRAGYLYGFFNQGVLRTLVTPDTVSKDKNHYCIIFNKEKQYNNEILIRKVDAEYVQDMYYSDSLEEYENSFKYIKTDEEGYAHLFCFNANENGICIEIKKGPTGRAAKCYCKDVEWYSNVLKINRGYKSANGALVTINDVEIPFHNGIKREACSQIINSFISKDKMLKEDADASIASNSIYNIVNDSVHYCFEPNDGKKYYNEELNEAMAKETVKGSAKVKTRR